MKSNVDFTFPVTLATSQMLNTHARLGFTTLDNAKNIFIIAESSFGYDSIQSTEMSECWVCVAGA
jgi:hypothetical protein